MVMPTCPNCDFLFTCDLFDFPVSLRLLLGRAELLLPQEERHPHRLEAAAAAREAAPEVVVGSLVELCQLHVLDDPLVEGVGPGLAVEARHVLRGLAARPVVLVLLELVGAPRGEPLDDAAALGEGLPRDHLVRAVAELLHDAHGHHGALLALKTTV